MLKNMKKALSLTLVTAMVVTICPQGQLVNISAADNTPYCISEGRPVYVSSGKNEDYSVDGDTSTRWESDYKNKIEWMYVDLGAKADLDHVYLKWEAAYAKSYQIQFSNDEENWTTVYTKGNGSGSEETPEETVKPGAMAISVGRKKKNDNGTVSSSFSWSAVSGAVTYKIFVENNGQEEVATAPDGFIFDKDSRLDLNNEVKLLEGTHKYIVRAYNSKGEVITSGEVTISGDVTVEETTEAPTNSGETTPVVDDKEQTIDLTKIIDNKEGRQARYVRVLMTEKALPAYGYSLYEFQVYGTNGVVERPVDYGVNLALNKPVKSKSNIVKSGDTEKEVNTRDEWWMYDSDGNLREDAYNNVKPENAVDGNTKSSFTSYQGDDQWIYVDLQKEYTIGRVVVNFNSDAAKMYDIQVSSDAKTWTTVHRNLRGYANMIDDVTMYQKNVRYVRILGYTKVESGSGVGINELSVYEYREGDSKENETIAPLPTRQVINNKNGKGSYVSGEMYKEKNKLPTFVNEETIKTPIDSNSWWSSAMVQTFSNLLCSTPLKAKFSTKGLGVLLATAGWVGTRKETDLGTDQSTETGIDFYVLPEKYNSKKGYDRVESYGDYSVQLGLMDNSGMQMKSTVVKGSPYIFSEFCDNTTFFINSSSITEFFDGNGNSILAKEGDTITTDHIGFKSMDDENTKAKNDGSYYCMNVPEGTTFKVMVAGSRYNVKVTFPSKNENYMSLAAMTKKGDIDQYYKHGYAFVTNTHVGYTFDQANNKVVTTYIATTKTMRKGFSNETMHCLFPHQWKYSSDADNPDATYYSIRGDMKSIWANEYKTTQQFSGLLPTFTKPDSGMFNTTEMVEYLNQVVASKINTAPVADAYWEGKNVHPLAISALMADQLGETEIREKLLKKLKSIMVDWFTYDGEDDDCYLIYNKDWGTLYYPESSFGANAAICDHHFTYGYFMFGAAVLATYDKQFYNDYKDMIELLVRDYADPKKPEDDGNMFCKFRAFDQYSGHSWAGGYADSDSGNNQESASEALFSWVGMYLWGEVSQNSTYIDAGAYGFTTEMEAIEQYWFDYDETNWLGDHPDRAADQAYDYPFQGTGQIYGASMGYGTYFGGQPVYVYGIQWLPISEYLTNYGMNQEKCAKIYQGLVDDTNYAINIEKKLFDQDLANGVSADDSWHNPDKYVTPDNGWQHITWPFLSQTNAQSAYDKFKANVTNVQVEDRANTLWFISAMDQLGYRTNDYMVTGNITGSVYRKDTNGKTVYTAEVWNATDKTQTVAIKDKFGKQIGKANIGAKAFVSFNIDTEKQFELTQTATPTVKATALATGKVTEDVTGKVTFDDTQLVELSCSDADAKIYYTTDGTIPTTESKEYTGKILISSNTTLKAVAVKDGYLDSAYSATVFEIAGDTVSSSDNLGLKKKATASSSKGANTADMAFDGTTDTRWQADNEADDEWIQVDLGSVQAVNAVTINWEAAYAAKYEIQVSTDGKEWTTVAKENGMVGEITSSFAATKARYVKMQGVSRGTQYGYSIYEMQVFGAVQAKAPTITPVSGTYKGTQTVTMSTAVKGAEIKYTTDGATPTEDSATYEGPITVDKSVTIKAVTYRKGMLLSDPVQSDIIIEGTISLNKTEATVAIGNKLQLSAITDQSVTFSSDNAGVAKVDTNGLVEGISKGTATITAKAANGQKATCKITVTDPVHITSIEIAPQNLEIKNKTSETLKLTINPSNTTDDTTVTWTSKDEKIATVNDAGTVTAKSEGTTTITAKIGKFEAKCEVTVLPITVEEMVADGQFNIGLGKNVVALPNKQNGEGGSESNITDGNFEGKHIATAFATTGTSYTLDLGDAYDSATIDKLVVKYKENNGGDTPVNGYEIQYSTNGVDFETVKKATGDSVKDACENKNCVDTQDMTGVTGEVRYIRFYYPEAYTWGVQVREIAALSTDKNAKKAELQYCDDPAEVTVKSDKYCQITYTIKADENQDDYKYMVYLNNNLVGDRVTAGTYTIDNLDAGTYTVKVVSYYNKLTSKGISKEVKVDDGSLKDYINTVRNISKGAKITVDKVYEGEGNQDVSSLTDGIVSDNNGVCVHTEHGAQTATINMDLGENYPISNIEEFLIAFKADNTYAKTYTVEFSADGQNFQEMINVKDAKYKDVMENKIDPSTYNYDTVRYVRVKLNDGSYSWGYQISEVAIMGTDIYMPVEPEGLVVESPTYNTVTVTWTGADNGQTYWVYIDGKVKDMNLASAGTYTYNNIDAGTHIVKVTSRLNGIESKGVTKEVVVANQPTTTPELTTTTKPSETTTQAPTINPSGTTEVTTKPGETIQATTKADETTKSDATQAPTTKSGENTSDIGNGGNTTVAPSASSDINVKVGKTKVTKATKKKRTTKAKISLKKVAGAKGYEVRVSTTKKFKAKKTITKVFKRNKLTFKKLKKNKKYYVQARAFTVINGNKKYGPWSAKKKMKLTK